MYFLRDAARRIVFSTPYASLDAHCTARERSFFSLLLIFLPWPVLVPSLSEAATGRFVGSTGASNATFP